MAFASAGGYGNLPNGNWSPVIYSKKAQIAFRRASVVQAITNTEYYGEISSAGDTVKIIKEPDIQVTPYYRGSQVVAQDLDDEEITLTVDQANSFAFKVDDIEAKQSHINWESLATNRAGYKLANAMDRNVLSYMATNAGIAGSTYSLGTTGSPVTVKSSGGTYTPLALLNRLQRYMNEEDVPEDSRWFVGDPWFYELLGAEDSKVLSADYTERGKLSNGLVYTGELRGFKLYMSNNLPSAGTGPSGGATNYGYVLAGHMSSTATAEQINKTESFRDPDSFADVVRGLHVFGRKVLRPNALASVVYNNA